ncbi:hypothetical protein BDV39DRAFT_215249 [Aspergillus sergii]|uniref:Uncharacterized protein n=1 Tax=Aspergillus sergii TaxID=1034303 RepID=A0A5N6X1N3_9EURO|nr:hypothetical protein BDV39DRAFT_215249 [Aspergillus sergii]
MSVTQFSCEVFGPITSGTVDDFELTFARRSLTRLKQRLGPHGLLDLFRPDIESSDQYWDETVAKSKGKLRPAEVSVIIRGISAPVFLKWAKSASGPAILGGHPEHYQSTLEKVGEENKHTVVETLGSHISYFTISNHGSQSPTDRVSGRDTSYPYTMVGRGYTKSGVNNGEILHQFRDHEDGQGFDAKLAIWFPAAVEDELLETHRQHLAVEFRNFARAAREDLLKKPIPAGNHV